MTVRSMLRTTRKPFRSVLSHILRATARSTTTCRSVVTARVPAAAQEASPGSPLVGQSWDTEKRGIFPLD